MKYLASIILYEIGDMVSRSFLVNYSTGGWLYQKIMGASVMLDDEKRVWKDPKGNE